MTGEIVFLDSSCWVAATLNPRGGAGRIVDLAGVGVVTLAISMRVVHEVRSVPYCKAVSTSQKIKMAA